jgi:hypothetical protein
LQKLRKIAASIGIVFVAFSPLLFQSPAYAQSFEEAQLALAAGQQEVTDATLAKETADQKVSSTLAEYEASQVNRANAQNEYDSNLIPDPDWVRPTEQVAHTREVSHIETITTTTTVEHVTPTPHTEIVTHTQEVPVVTQVATTTYVPRTTTTVVPGGLVAKSYNRQGYNNAPPLPTANETPLSVQNVQNIDFQWGGGLVLNSGKAEDVLVAFEGNIMVPSDGWYSFFAPGDDGIKLTIAGMNVINDWYDKGGGGTISEPVWIRAGILYPTTLYYYENGGGAWVQLYYSTADTALTVVPPSWFGETTVTETTYEAVTTYEDVVTWVTETTFEEVIVWVDVITYEDVTTSEDIVVWETETFFTEEPVLDATAPLIHDPVLQAVLIDKVAAELTSKSIYDSAVIDQENADNRLNTAVAAIPALTQAVIDATPVEEPVDPVPSEEEPASEPSPSEEPVEEPTPVQPEPVQPPDEAAATEESLAVMENLTEVDPQELSEAQVEELVEAAYTVLENTEQGSPEYTQALEALFVAAQADDIEVDPELAAVPVLGATVVALTDAINFMGNVGSDMSPAVRELAEKQVVVAVVAVGAAVQAATGAATSAAAAAASSVSSRKN